MTGRHLLLVSLGPVQDFIAQARRSRDLWFGSHLLSELSRAAAWRLAEDGAELIFPALARGNPELAACDTPTRSGGSPPVSVANKLLAELAEEVDPRACASAAREAVRERWRRIAERVRQERAGVLAHDVGDVWNEQVEDILEFYAVWVPFGADYQAARHAAEQALAGRKNLRDFRPWQQDRSGAPKSSLDGARVSVLDGNRNRPAFRRLRIADGEQLDAIGLIKRAGFEPEQFVPIVNMAAGAWLGRAAEIAGNELAALSDACKAQKISPVHRRDLPVIEPFPFDASVLYPSRWLSSLKELDQPLTDTAAVRAWGETHVRPLLRAMKGEPPAYVACLAADGDHMGKALDGLGCAAENRTFSEALAQFPAEARRIVEQQHRGSLIYAGGDDVLAFLPVATAPRCAADLARSFRECMQQALHGAEPPTLSVGLGIGHFMEQMSVLLALARRAERAAKDAGRDALAIIVDKRSGGERRVALKWGTDPIARFAKDAALLDDRLSTGKVHELEELLRRFPEPDQVTDTPVMAGALAAYLAGILAHASEGAKATLDDIGIDKTTACYAALRKEMHKAIDRILVVRSLREWGYGREWGSA
jgi:CRISPR-associated protein Cmr2